jgi:hypothetical protein
MQRPGFHALTPSSVDPNARLNTQDQKRINKAQRDGFG